MDEGCLCSLVARHTPTFFLHPKEEYLPSSVEFFLENCELRQKVLPPAGGSGKARNQAAFKVLLKRGEVTVSKLIEAQKNEPTGSLYLEVAPEAYKGPDKAQLDDVPVYAIPKRVMQGTECEALEISYVTVYPYNGSYRVLGLFKTGQHAGDIEHCTARVDPSTGQLLGMWYNSHRSRDGCWVAGAEVPRDPQTHRPAAYVAVNGHGTYPRPGLVPRGFCFANDVCDDTGLVWCPRTVIIVPPPADKPAAEMRAKVCSNGSSGSPTDQQCCSCSCRVLEVRSRGSRLPPLPQSTGSDGKEERQAGNLPAVVPNDPCGWLEFRGKWGPSTDAPLNQGWWTSAECPVSRTAFLRLCGQCAAEPATV